MSTEDHARIQWVKLTNSEEEVWWPSVVYNNIGEALRLSSTDTLVQSQLFTRYWKTQANCKSISIAFLLGNVEHHTEKYVFIENRENVLPFYINFGRFYDDSNASLKSALNEAVDRIRSSSNNNLRSNSVSKLQRSNEDQMKNPELIQTPPRSNINLQNNSVSKLQHSNEDQMKNPELIQTPPRRPRGRPKKGTKSFSGTEDGASVSTPSLITPQPNRPEGRSRKSPIAMDRSIESIAKPRSIVKGINPHDSWKIVLKKLRQSGWTYRKGGCFGLDDFYHVPPNGSVPSGNQNAVKNEDYFASEEELKSFVKTEYQWEGESTGRKKIIPENFSNDTDLWSKMQLLGWRYLQEHNFYVTPGGSTRNGEEGLDYFRSWKRAKDYVVENCDQNSNGPTAQKKMKKKTTKLSKSSARKVPAKKVASVKHSVKTKREPLKKTVAHGHETLPEDDSILKSISPLHRNFNIISDFLSNVFDKSYYSSNPKLMHALGGSGKSMCVTMACKTFVKNNPKKIMTTLYYNAKRKRNKDIVQYCGVMLGLSLSAKPNMIENALRKTNSKRMLLLIVDEADMLFSEEASKWKHLFEWAYSPDFNFAMIIISNSSFDEEFMSLIPEGSDLDSKPNLFFHEVHKNNPCAPLPRKPLISHKC